jgi:YbgC/YbaW family acyl-CoA thioester hydrolase
MYYFLFTDRGATTDKSVTFRVMPWHLDLYGHVNNSYYLNYYNRARLVFMSQRGILQRLIREKVKAVITQNTVEYKKPLKCFEVIQVFTSISNVDGRNITLEHKIFRTGEEISNCQTQAKILCFNKDIVESMKKDLFNNDNR